VSSACRQGCPLVHNIDYWLRPKATENGVSGGITKLEKAGEKFRGQSPSVGDNFGADRAKRKANQCKVLVSILGFHIGYIVTKLFEYPIKI